MLQLTIAESAVTAVAFFYVIGGCLGSGIGQCRKHVQTDGIDVIM